MSTSANLHIVTTGDLPPGRVAFGRAIVWGSGGLLAVIFALQTAQALGWIDLGLRTWRPNKAFHPITWSRSSSN